MFNKVDYVMVNVSDMSRSVAFYRDTLGLARLSGSAAQTKGG
jgi:catechol 2,3-dioxygenase-like lactoylglutathione lyase family enzyme